MDELITAIRFPIGLLGIVIVTIVRVLAFPIEALLAALLFPIAALTWSRSELRTSWLGTFPNTIRDIPTNNKDIWDWIYSR